MASLKKTLLFVLFLAQLVLANGQTETGLRLITPADDFKTAERVLLVLDQDLYLAGEKVNFFALTFDAALQIPIELSSVLYVELYNQDNNVISAKKYLLKKGEGTYDIDLPRQIETGYYYLRAYTNYMKNFGASAFFTKRIKVVNPFLKTKSPTSEVLSAVEMKLNIGVDGGKLVYGIENKLTFRSSVNEHILARLYENDSVFAELDSKNGFGVFNFTPNPGYNYRIEAASASKGKAVVKIKEIVSTGVVCKLDSISNRNVYLKVLSRGEQKFPLSLFVENNGLLYKFPREVNTPEALLSMELPAGLNKITVINSAQNEVSKRIVYIEPVASLGITAKPFNKQAFPDDSLILNINADSSDSIHYLIAMNLGDSATSPSIQSMIKSWVYTSSIARITNKFLATEQELSGILTTDVNDYILSYNDSSAAIGDPVKITYLPEISGDIVTGRITQPGVKSLAENKNIYLSCVDSICWVDRCKTDKQGRFIAMLPFGHQAESLVITVQDTIGSYAIRMDDEFYPDFLKITKESFYPDSTLKETIEARMINLQVNDAYPERHKCVMSPNSQLRFYGKPDAEYQFRKYVNLPLFEEFVFEIVKEATIVRKGKQTVINVKNSLNKSIGDNPLIIFDGVPLLKTDKIGRIPTEKLRSIRVVGNKFFWGNEVYDGVIDITSNSKSFNLVDADKNSTTVLFSPVITEKEVYPVQTSNIPVYVSDVFFNRIDSASGNHAIKIGLPQNSGIYSLSVFGYTKNGEWGSLLMPGTLNVGRQE